MKFVKSNAGLCLTLGTLDISASTAIEGMLKEAGVGFTKGSGDLGGVCYKIESKYQQKVENMVYGWAVVFNDLKHALYHAERK